MPLRAPAGYMVLMSGRSRLELLNISVALAINVAACFLLIPQYGVVGAALANLAASFAINLMRAAQVWFSCECMLIIVAT